MCESAQETESRIKDNQLAEPLEREDADISKKAKDLRNAFLVTLVISLGIIITTSKAGLALGFYIKPPMDEGLFHFIFASVAVLYGGMFFYAVSWQAIRKRTANAAILISVAVLAAYIYSIAATFFTGGESFYSMATLLLSLILLGYWIETVIWGRMAASAQSFLNNNPQMVGLVEDAQKFSTPLQDRIENVTPVLALLVIAAGVLTFLFWYLAFGYGLAFAFIAAIAVVVAAGLDALTLAVPSAVAVGAGIGISQGILIRDATAIEKAAYIDTVVFDKISCLTEGNPRVTDIIHIGKLTEPGLLRLAASIEKTSKSVVAQAIIKAAEDQVGKGIPNPQEYKHIPGKGAKGELETRTIIVGNEQLMVESGIDISHVEDRAEELARRSRTVAYVAVDGHIEGVLGIKDKVRANAQEMVKKLQDSKIEVAMITDDDYRTATAIAAELNIDKVYADVLPEDRAGKIKEIQNQGLRVAVVGNGVSDTDALEQADISFAVTDSTNLDVKSGSIILARNNPFDVISAIALSKLITGKVKQNTALAIAYSVIMIPLAAGVLYPLLHFPFRPELAAVAMSVSTLAVMGNSLLLRRQASKVMQL